MSEFKLLKQVRALIEDEANGFIMSEHHCGTAACIAGWANNIVQDPDCWFQGETDLKEEGTPSQLFYTEDWPESYQQAIIGKAEALGFNPEEDEDEDDDSWIYAATIFLESSDEGTRFLRLLALALIDHVIADDGDMPDDDFPLPPGVSA